MLKTQRIGLFVSREEKQWVVELARLEGGLSQASLICPLIHQAATHHCLATQADKHQMLEERQDERASTKSK